MKNEKHPTMAQLRDGIGSGGTGSKASANDPAASPLGTDDEAAGTTPTARRIEMAQEAEKKIGEAAKGRAAREADDNAHSQRGSGTPYAKEEHMNEELARQKKA